MANLRGGTTVGGDLIVLNDVIASVIRPLASTGTAPMVVNSTTMVNNLNVQYLNGQAGTYYTTANNLSGTIPSSVLGNSFLYVGTTQIALNRSSGAIALTGITSIDGNSATATKLATARTFSLNGFGNTTNVSFDGAANVTLNLPGSYGSITGQTLNSSIPLLGNSMGMANVSDSPAGAGPVWGRFLQISYVDNTTNVWQTQLWQQGSSGDMWIRSKEGGNYDSWGTQWYKFITSGDISSQTVAYAGLTVTSVTQNSHGFSVGNIIRVSGANTFVKAQANSAANAEVVGYVTSVADANNFTYTTGGMVTAGVPAATAGTVYYLDPTTAGAITSTEPTTAGQISKPVLIVIESAAKAAFVNFRGYTIVAGASYVPTSTTVNGKALSGNITLVFDSTDFSLSDVTTNDANASRHGLLPKLSGNAADVLKGNGTWGAASSFWTTVAGSPTRASNTTFTVTGDYTSIFAKGLILKWTESSVTRVAMVSIPSTYSNPNTTVTLVGDVMASIDSNSLKYCLIGIEAFKTNFNVYGNISANGTDIASAFYATEPYRVLGADLQVGVAGVTNNTTIDINKGGVTMFTTKPTLATTIAYSPTTFTADTSTSLALGDKVTIDIDAVQTTPAKDLYVQLYLFPTRYLNL